MHDNNIQKISFDLIKKKSLPVTYYTFDIAIYMNGTPSIFFLCVLRKGKRKDDQKVGFSSKTGMTTV